MDREQEDREIDSLAAMTRDAINAQRSPRDVACPKCGAAAGKPCTKGVRWSNKPYSGSHVHEARRRALDN